MENDIRQPNKFKEFYQYTFNFAKDTGAKNLGKSSVSCEVGYRETGKLAELTDDCCTGIEDALRTWKVVLAGRFSLLNEWCTFVEVSCQTFLTHACVSQTSFSNCLVAAEGNHYFGLWDRAI